MTSTVSAFLTRNKYGMDQFQEYIHLSRYARWRDDFNRRETWEETVTRYCDYMVNFVKKKTGVDVSAELAEAKDHILFLGLVPSMRALMTAGPALDRDHMAGFNCSFVCVDNVRVFDEILYVLCCGTGLGFSVERQHIAKLPPVAEEFHTTDTTIIVADSKVGWAKAFRELIALLYQGQIPNIDYSKIRPAGARLKTFGGRASGPQPLMDLFAFTINLFKNAAGRKLTSLECHDLVCYIAQIVVVGGVRRSALISLSNLSDDRMRVAKSGQWWESNGQRALANNTAVYTEKPEIGIFMKEWQALYDSKSGERGIFNRGAAKEQIAKLNGRREYFDDMGLNPCGEILLRNAGLCNLTEVIIKSDDTFETLKRKVRVATILGTIQSLFTDFRYVRNVWKKNAEEERLLGVSFTGIMDHAVLNHPNEEGKKWLNAFRSHAVEVNAEYAAKFGINPAAAITTGKPSGTVSTLANSASGIHARHSPFYIRTVRGDKKDPLATMMVDAGFPVEPDVMKPDSTWVFSFPIKSPEGSVYRTDMTAIDQLEQWKFFKNEYCEHNQSVTITVREHEWMEVGAWVYKNFDDVLGISFLPHSDHVYRQAPYQECTEAEYLAAVEKMPKSVDWSALSLYETEDMTTGTREAACSAGGCEVT